jgi:hypothetical protein
MAAALLMHVDYLTPSFMMSEPRRPSKTRRMTIRPPRFRTLVWGWRDPTFRSGFFYGPGRINGSKIRSMPRRTTRTFKSALKWVAQTLRRAHWLKTSQNRPFRQASFDGPSSYRAKNFSTKIIGLRIRLDIAHSWR